MEDGINSAELQTLLDYYEKEKGISKEALNEAIREAVDYRTGSSGVRSTAEDAIAAGSVLVPKRPCLV